MIIRIVKMIFDQKNVTDFLDIFNQSKQLIRNFEGCTHLELLYDNNSPNIFFTYSYWESEDYLDYYRASDLFKNIWQKTKPLFSQKAEAWSLVQHVVI